MTSVCIVKAGDIIEFNKGDEIHTMVNKELLFAGGESNDGHRGGRQFKLIPPPLYRHQVTF